MTYQVFLPCLCLQPYIEQYTLLTPSPNLTQPEQIPPGGKSGIIINLGADYQAKLAGVTQKLPSVAIGGQLTQILKLDKPADGQILLINFRPTGLYQLLGLPMAELTNQIVPLNELVAVSRSQSWLSLANQLRDITGTPKRIQRVEAHLLTYVNRMSHSSANWVDAATTWLSQPGDRRIQQLVTELRMSPRQLTRVFGQQVGIAPKHFAQVMRFRNIFRAITISDCLSWQDLVHTGGWYDQAHFCNDIYRMTGQTPTAFFAKHHAVADIMINQS